MSCINDCFVDGGWHLLAAAEIVVDANLDVVDVHVGRGIHTLDCLLGRVGYDDWTSNAQTCMRQVAPFTVSDSDTLWPVAPEANDGGHAVAGVERKLTRHMLLGIERGVGFESTHVVDMSMCIDKARRNSAA